MATKSKTENPSIEIGQRIVEARKELGMTQVELAELIGVSQRSMQAYEVGEVIPYRKMRDLERVLDRPMGWILHGEDAVESKDEQLAQIQKTLDELVRAVKALTRRLPA